MESQEKKDRPVFERSIMLTRFKLSQQKRELKEQSQSPALKSPKTSTKKQKSLIKKKEELKSNVNDEFHPNKLKRKKNANKIVLKPKNDLKVIDWNDVKRKRLETKTKSFNIKRKKTKPTSDVYEGTSSLDSDVSFDEVIRRADDNLDDEGLMEILTCPSPVWWEDPPDGKYMEGPIIIKTNTLASIPDLEPRSRRKKARKLTPQKIVKEECKTNDSIVEKPLQNNVLNKTTDLKFNKKRNKLENLLSTMKNKLKDAENSTKDIKEDGVSEDINKIDEEAIPEIADLSGDSTYIDISIFDNDILKHLENIKIPIEDIEQAKSKKQITNAPKRKHYKHKVFYTKKSKSLLKNPIEKSQTEKSQTENLNIIDIGNVKINLESLKHIKNLKIGIPREQIINKNEKSIVTKKISSKKSLKTGNNDNDLSNNEMPLIVKDDVPTNETKNLEKSLKSGNNEIKNNDLSNNEIPLNIKDEVLNETKNFEKSLEIENNERESNDLSDNDIPFNIKNELITIETDNFEKSLENDNNETNIFSNNEIPLKIKDEIITNDSEEYVTVFEIINSDDETAKNPETIIEETEIKSEMPSIEETDKSKLNSYYKKCKKLTKKDTKTFKKKSNKVKDKIKDAKICIDCNLDTKNSIIVPSTTDIKYCLKCSSIFDADICSYCIKKEEKQKETI